MMINCICVEMCIRDSHLGASDLSGAPGGLSVHRGGQIRLAPVELLPGQGLAGMKGQHPGPGGDVYKRQL